MTADYTALEATEVERRVREIRDLMRPLELRLAELRSERDVLLTELRRRERLATRERRSEVKESIRAGAAPSLAELVESLGEGSFDAYRFNLKTGGEVRLGFPGARAQSITWTDGKQVAQAHDFADCARYFAAGWEMGAPGKPGVRVHFAGTRQERLVEASEIHGAPTR